MHFGFYFLNGVDCDVGWEYCIELEQRVFDVVDGFCDVEVCNVVVGVYACVGSSSADDVRLFASEYFGEGVVHLLLY